jgi:hypothetical protein
VVVQQSAVGHQAGVGGLAGAHPVGKPVNHLAHWAGVHGSLLAAMIVTTLAAGSLLYAAWRTAARARPADLRRPWWMPAISTTARSSPI